MSAQRSVFPLFPSMPRVPPNQSKMTPDQHESLVDRFDKRRGENPNDGPFPKKVGPIGAGPIDRPISEDAETQQEWELLEKVTDAIRLAAITEQVQHARIQFEQKDRRKTEAGPEVSD